jgi:hypothetical protein
MGRQGSNCIRTDSRVTRLPLVLKRYDPKGYWAEIRSNGDTGATGYDNRTTKRVDKEQNCGQDDDMQ